LKLIKNCTKSQIMGIDFTVRKKHPLECLDSVESKHYYKQSIAKFLSVLHL